MTKLILERWLTKYKVLLVTGLIIGIRRNGAGIPTYDI